VGSFVCHSRACEDIPNIVGLELDLRKLTSISLQQFQAVLSVERDSKSQQEWSLALRISQHPNKGRSYSLIDLDLDDIHRGETRS
jgi:hypothetical protein